MAFKKFLYYCGVMMFVTSVLCGLLCIVSLFVIGIMYAFDIPLAATSYRIQIFDNIIHFCFSIQGGLLGYLMQVPYVAALVPRRMATIDYGVNWRRDGF